MMPRSENRVLADSQAVSQNQVKVYCNKYGDTIEYTYLGMGIINGRRFTRCTAVATCGDTVKILKSMKAAQSLINKSRNEITIFGEII